MKRVFLALLIMIFLATLALAYTDTPNENKNHVKFCASERIQNFTELKLNLKSLKESCKADYKTCLVSTEFNKRICKNQYNLCKKNIIDVRKNNTESIKEGFRKCKEECKKLWWFELSNKECQLKEFCGEYTYAEVITFPSRTKCEFYKRENCEDCNKTKKNQ